jgi:amidohydrolase
MNLYEIVRKHSKQIANTLKVLEELAEPSFKEFKTTEYIVSELTSAGVFEFTNLKTGCFGTIDSGKDKTIAIRADIDALPFNDEKSVYRHLCGHHFHTAALLETIKIIKKENISIGTNLRFIFQPAEEVVSGARFMIENGCMDDVAEIYGLHVDPELYMGEIYIEPVSVMAGARHFDIEITGKSTHAAYPHQGVDTIVAASNFITGAQSIVSRMVDPLKNAVLTFGAISGGSACNIIPEFVKIKGTFRFFDEEVNHIIESKLKKLLDSVDVFFGTKSRIDIDDGTKPVTNDKNLSCKIKNILSNDRFTFYPSQHLSMGGEDFCFYNEFAPALFIKFGIRRSQEIVSIHNKNFCVTVEPLYEAVYLWLKILTAGV